MAHKSLSPAVTALAALVEECAHMRAHSLEATDDPSWTQRALCAEAAGRDLLLAWLRPTAFPTKTALGAELKRLMGLTQTLLLASSPLDGLVSTVTVVSRHVDLADGAAWTLRDLALLIVLAAREDGAVDMVVHLDTEDCHVRLRVETDQPGLACMPPAHPRIVALRRRLRPIQGTWAGSATQHGSWLIDVRIPKLPSRETSNEDDS